MNEAEMGIIGCILVDSKCLYQVYQNLKPEMFFEEFYRDAYRESLVMFDSGLKVSHLELAQRLESHKHDQETIRSNLLEAVKICPTTALIKGYATTVINEYKSRNVKMLIERIDLYPKCINDTLSEIISRCEELLENKSVKSKSMSQIVKEQKDLYFKDIKRKVVHTGFPRLDNCLGGLEGGDVIVIGARPGVGKSAISLQMIKKICEAGKKVGYFNLEMTEPQVYQRAVSSLSNISITRIKRALNFVNDEKERYDKANEILKKYNLIISTGSKTVSEIRAECRHQNFDIIIIDYLQLIKQDRQSNNRATEVGYISKAIKALSTELNIPIILLSQMNRSSESRDTKEPTMAELRESGDIEQDASIIILLWRLIEDDNSLVGLKVDKNRMGSLLKLGLDFHGDTVQFTERDEDFKDTLLSANAHETFNNNKKPSNWSELRKTKDTSKKKKDETTTQESIW